MPNADNAPKLTKTKRRELARELIRSYDIGDRFSDSDSLRFGEICGYKFEWVQRMVPERGNAPAVHVYWPAEDYTGSWGWRKSIDGYDQRQNILSAMRLASRSGSFKQVKKDICVHCGSMERLSVDHKSTSFLTIADRFIKDHGKPEIENVDFSWKLVDPKSFLVFHDALADYQVLCISCNARKGIKT